VLIINDHGQNNVVSISDQDRNQNNFVINFKGSGNTVHIGNGSRFTNASITLGSNSTLSLGSNCNLNQLEVYTRNDAVISVGDNVNSTWHARLYAHEKGEISIGSDCLIASGVLITVSDMHSIIDVTSGKRVNPAENIHISNRVWIAEGVKILGGASIGEHSVIGAGSVVTGNLPSNSVCVGAPARAVKSGITWRTDLI
jgi:acetyltransferase-like isoleucine patch superfamily enzyme